MKMQYTMKYYVSVKKCIYILLGGKVHTILKPCLQSSFGITSHFYNSGNDGNPSKVYGRRQQTTANLEYSQL